MTGEKLSNFALWSREDKVTENLGFNNIITDFAEMKERKIYFVKNI